MPRTLSCAMVVAAGLIGLAAVDRAAARGVADDVGLTDLLARLGGNVPTGAGVVVGQVEALENGNYGPNQADPEFLGKTFIAQSGAPGNSGHATLVAKNYYGNATSIAPGVTTVFLYSAGPWIGSGYLRNGQPGLGPLPTPGGIKVFNNSWIADGSDAADNDVLRRADFVVKRDELIISSGMNNGGPQAPLMSHLFNGLSVGLSNGTHTAGLSLAGIDGPGRMKPEIVAPNGATSFATPVVNAAAAVLLNTSAVDPGLVSNINAKRAMTIKSILLAGALHRPGWTNNPATSGPNRGLTTTPLDPVYGVDLVNIDRSHLILTGLEQDGPLFEPASVNALYRGWDCAIVPASSARYYRFHVGQTASEVSILATWDRSVAANFGSWSMANFTLSLFRVDLAKQVLVPLVGDDGLPYFGGGNVVSQSAVDNVEHLYITNLQPGDYVIEVKRADALPANWEMAVAWLLPKRTGDVDGDGFVNVDDLLDVIGAWGNCPSPCLPVCPADQNGNCVVNVDDLLVVINNWG